MAMRRLPGDCARRYGYRPVSMERFVDRKQHDGTCFRAADWTVVGGTAGRGRCARPAQRVPVKLVFLRPLQQDWRAVVEAACRDARALGKASLSTSSGRTSWARRRWGMRACGRDW